MSQCKYLFLLCISLPVIACSCPNIISRSEWNANPPKSSKPLREFPAPFVVVHHSDGPNCFTLQSCKNRVKGIQNYHVNHNGWQDIGYNFLIGGDGNIYEGRGWNIWGAHVPKYNSNSIGICIIGNFMNTSPPSQQLTALENLIACAKNSNQIQSDYHLIGHRQGGKTSCPGNDLFDILKSWPHFDGSIPVQ